MIDATWLKALFKALVLPPTGPLLLAAAGLWLLARVPRLGRFLAWSGVLALLALSTPTIALLLSRLVDDSPPLDLERARSAQAIVILGGGVRRHAAEYGGDTLGRLTLERVRYGARVARLTGLPVLVSGGVVFGGEPEARLMQAALEDEFGVPVRWVEWRSRNTHENAARSAAILIAEHIGRVVLVAHSVDMPRAKAEFAAQGVETIPAPTGIPNGAIDTALDLLPSLAALQASYYALYEMLANTVRRITPARTAPAATGRARPAGTLRFANRRGGAGIEFLRFCHNLSSTARSPRNRTFIGSSPHAARFCGVPSRLGLESTRDAVFIKDATKDPGRRRGECGKSQAIASNFVIG